MANVLTRRCFEGKVLLFQNAKAIENTSSPEGETAPTIIYDLE